MLMSCTIKIRRVLFCLSLLSYSLAAHSQGFVEGQHYTVLKSPIKAASNELTEFFSFSCPGCYAIEPSLQSLVENQAEISLRRVHAPFGGRNAKYAQKVFVLMVLLGEELSKQAIFDRIHLARDTFDSDQEVVRYFTDLAYDEATVSGTLRSFSADAMIRRMNKEVISGQITSVPTLIWAGKYQINLQALADQSSLSELIAYLVSLD
jgi:thiol:disulfide interchange protein DsbA